MATVIANAAGFERLKERVKKHANKAMKLGQVPPTMRVGVITVIPVQDGYFANWNQYSLYRVSVEGTVPHINGWDVVARVEHLGSGTLVHLTPGVDAVDPKWRTWGNVCEHCNTDRRRNDLVILRHEDGREIAVGRNCLADFLGCDGDEVNLAYWFRQPRYDEDDYLGGEHVHLYTAVQVLTRASAIIRHLGYVSKSTSDREGVSPTSHWLDMMLHNASHFRSLFRDVVSNDADADIASKVLEWCLGNRESSSEYLRNLCLICENEVVHPKQLGYIASAISAWERAMQDEMQRKHEKPKAWLDGDKVKNLEAKVLRASISQGYYGTTTIVAMVSEDDDYQYPMVWFATGSHELKPGEMVTVSGSVKDRNEHPKYGKQTILTRCKIS
jgi:hypothetical protein